MPVMIGVRVLLVSGDIQTIDTLCEFMEKLAMHVEVCSDIASAAGKLCHSKFDGVIVDFHDRAEALELLKKQREMTSYKSAVAIALLKNSDEMPSAFRAGASFVLVRPLSPTVLMRTLKASYPLMVRERRRSFAVRCRSPSTSPLVHDRNLWLRQRISARVVSLSRPRLGCRLEKEWSCGSPCPASRTLLK